MMDAFALQRWVSLEEAKEMFAPPKPAPLPDDWMRVAPGTDAAIWRPWSRETGEL